MSRLTIRPPLTREAAALAGLAARTFSHTYAHILPAPDLAAYLKKTFTAEGFRQDMDNPRILLLVAADREALCGYTKFAPAEAPLILGGEDAVEMVRLYVRSDYHNRGIGKALLAAGQAAAREQGYKMCWLRVWEGNEKAIAFYVRNGFRDAGKAPYLVEAACRHVRIMVADL